MVGYTGTSTYLSSFRVNLGFFPRENSRGKRGLRQRYNIFENTFSKTPFFWVDVIFSHHRTIFSQFQKIARHPQTNIVTADFHKTFYFHNVDARQTNSRQHWPIERHKPQTQEDYSLILLIKSMAQEWVRRVIFPNGNPYFVCNTAALSLCDL